MSQPIIVIFGATGNQGGSVINSLLSDPTTATKYKLRGVTRDVSKPTAKALVEKGVEMVAADLDDAGSVNKAVEGAYGVFAVTDYWAKMDGKGEIRQGKNMANAALVSPLPSSQPLYILTVQAAGVQHFVLSTLKSPKKSQS